MIMKNISSQRRGITFNTGLMAQILRMLFPLTNTGRDSGKKDSQPAYSTSVDSFGNIEHYCLSELLMSNFAIKE